jgi:hypothetical protein
MNLIKKLASVAVCLGAFFALFIGAAFAGSTSDFGDGGEVAILGDTLDAVHSFTNVGTSTFTLTRPAEVWILVVGGGGSGGSDCGGGGGAGGFVESNHVVFAAGTYTVTVGKGGVGGSGGYSAISLGGVDIVRASGGGYGGSYAGHAGTAGGSGGGAANKGIGGPGTPGQGYAGGDADTRCMGGGGGAGGPGEYGSKAGGPGNLGGPGRSSYITGSEVYYAGGGGGGGYGYAEAPIMNGGIGGGGNGARHVSVATREGTTLPDGRSEYEAECGVNGLGGGGGGANNMGAGRPGGSGVVIIRIPGQPDNALRITCTPEYIGEADPAYGWVTNLASDSTFLASSIVTAITNEEKTAVYKQVGWTIYDKEDNVVSSGSGSSLVYTHPTPAEYRRLEWRWDKFVFGTVSAGDFGSVSSLGASLYSCSTPVTITAIPDSGVGFSYWSGALPKGIDASSASITFTPTVPFVITAHFGGAGYVMTNVGHNDILYTFFAADNIEFKRPVKTRILLVGGGGAGGHECSGGGGGGGMIDTNDFYLAAGTYAVSVGAGGKPKRGKGENGGNSSISYAGTAIFTAIGGGGGGGFASVAGVSGGCGGGGANGGAGGAGTDGQGYAGGNAASKCMGGGGGAGGPGEDGVNGGGPGNAGGPGRASDITGEEVYYAGGGGGGGYAYGSILINGGIGGGGNGARNVSVVTRQATTLPDGRNEYQAECGVDGLGGGGGGANNIAADYQGRPGGRGVVIIRVKRSVGLFIRVR